MYQPRLDPVLSDLIGARDFERMEEMGLPCEWIDRCRQSTGYWIAPDEYLWTPDSYFLVLKDMTREVLRQIRLASGGSFFSLPLREQCALVGAEYVSVPASDAECLRPDKGARLEEKVLRQLRKEGWRGERGEGASLVLAQLAMRHLVEAAGHEFWPYEWLSKVPPVYRVLTESERDALAQAAANVDEDGVVAVYEAWKRCPPRVALSAAANQCGLALDDVLACFRAIPKERLRAMCEQVMLGYGTTGWPDLTLTRAGELRQIEVKSRWDKFTQRQATWFRNFARPLGLRVSVLHVPV